PEDREDLGAHLGVAIVARGHDDRAGAAPQRFDHGHRRARAGRARLVRGGEHDTPAVTADEHGPAAERRVVALLHGRVEGVHVHVENGAGRRHPRALYVGRSAASLSAPWSRFAPVLLVFIMLLGTIVLMTRRGTASRQA